MTELLLGWPTVIVSGEVPAKRLQQLAETAGGGAPVTVGNLEDAFPALAESAAALDRAAPVAIAVETWRSGYYSSLRQQPQGATHSLIAIVSADCADGKASASTSGTLVLYDPRAGCANVFAPNLPFGRPFEMPAAPGAYAIYPSWLRSAILPVGPENEVTAIVASLAWRSNDLEKSQVRV